MFSQLSLEARGIAAYILKACTAWIAWQKIDAELIVIFDTNSQGPFFFITQFFCVCFMIQDHRLSNLLYTTVYGVTFVY